MRLKGSCHCQAVQFEVTSHTPHPFMRCYCSICRKTAGGGGFAINIMAEADTLDVTGMEHVNIYRAEFQNGNKKFEASSSRRHFCMHCGSCLWISDPTWPKWIYPFASAIDTELPIPPERVNLMVKYAASWCEIPQSKNDINFDEYPEESIEEWHKRHHLYIP